MSAPTSRPVHPCVLNVSEYTRGVEFAAFDGNRLITAGASTLCVYQIANTTQPFLIQTHCSGNLAGTIVNIGVIQHDIVVAFAGPTPKLSIVRIQNDELLSLSLIDLSEFPSDFDMIMKTNNNTIACILGGGSQIVVLNVRKGVAGQPYYLPLNSLKLKHHDASNTGEVSISTGFGDILDALFLEGYLEPVLVVLHSDPAGRVWQGRWGKHTGHLYCTALSVSTEHQRTAVLWSTSVPVDALYLTVTKKEGIFLVGANSITVLNSSGKQQQCIGVNGWAMSPDARPNLFVKLSIALDGSRWTWVNEQTAIVCLRYGHLYVFQKVSRESWCLLPTGHTLSNVGEIASLAVQGNNSTAGVLFAGSRLGDSVLLQYNFKSVETSWDKLGGKPRTSTNSDTAAVDETIFLGESWTDNNSQRDEMIRLEDEALYASVEPSAASNLVAPSDDEDESNNIAIFTVLEKLEAVDVLPNVGALGPSCEGPIAGVPDYLEVDETNKKVFGAPAVIIPAGFGSSGGLTLVTVPGRDDRMILAEHDCLNVECMFSLPVSKTVLLGMSPKGGGGIKVLQFQDESVAEIDAVDWAGEICRTKLLSAGETLDGFIVLVVKPDEQSALLVAARQVNGRLSVLRQHHLGQQDGIEVTGITPIIPVTSGGLAFGCLWSNGESEIVVVDSEGKTAKLSVESSPDLPFDMELDEELDQESRQRKEFYASGTTVAIDVFLAPALMFKASDCHEKEPSLAVPGSTTSGEPDSGGDEEIEERTDWSKLTVPKLKDELKTRGLDVKGKKADLVAALEKDDERKLKERKSARVAKSEPMISNERQDKEEAPDVSDAVFDEEDEELYGLEVKAETQADAFKQNQTHDLFCGDTQETLFVSVCRKSGQLDVYEVDLVQKSLRLFWSTKGAAIGLSILGQKDTSVREPTFHSVSATEMRFFECGPSSNDSGGRSAHLRRMCLAIKTSSSDFNLYKLVYDATNTPLFRRVPLRMVGRPSREQWKHRTKLMRKGMIAKDTADSADGFVYNSLLRFSNISGHDGLFDAGPRPFWFVCERGQPAAVVHQARHAAPAGGKPRPLIGFCTSANGQFLTLHERVGRVGSQRLTIFRGLSDALSTKGFVSGGTILETIPLGVTVQRIVFIDDESASTGQHPLYAVLISREVEVDQSGINSDGLSDEERRRIEEEKEKEKIAKQVEADLGGFDVDEEWVEEIEREDVFEINNDVGGAPPILQSIYSLWIVDAANNWMVVDSYELGEHEYGIDMQFMYLTEFKEDPGSASALANDDGPKRPFLVVGTGTVNHNGEDVVTKGRGLLFEVKIFKESVTASDPVAELTLIYEKNIFHGPVTTVSCLIAEGKHRLVIGAGSDVNIEQWGSNDRLTQVGFFRATMHILDISHFKSFLILSDAYDSLYFLVWRESDKSLTLLAKDYDPIPVHATGIMSRGSSMTFVCHDDRQNLQFFQYAPGEAAARGGNKLVCRADFHLGSQTISISPHYCRPTLLAHSATIDSTYAALKQQDPLFGRQDDDQRLGVYFGTTDGGICSIVPLSEPVYWRLMALQSVMTNALESDCALNPRAWRLYRRTARRGGCRYNDRKNSVIDGDLVLRFSDLAVSDQEDLASAIGSTVGLILDNLLDILCGSMIL